MTDLVTCEICCSDVEADRTTIMDCGHTFCDDCWRQHFKAQIGEAKACSIRCGFGSKVQGAQVVIG